MTVIEKPRPEAGTADPLASVPPALELQGLVKYFHPQGRPATNLPPAVDGLSLQVAPGELLTLLGPSGCGKTTTLRLIAGLEEPDGGAVWIGGHNMTNPPQPPNAGAWGWCFRITRCFRT